MPWGRTISNQAGIFIPLSVILIFGAFGKINFVFSNAGLSRHCSANGTQPEPLSPRPWANMIVAVCAATAGTATSDMLYSYSKGAV